MNYKGALHSKLPTVGTTIFTTMSRLAQEHKALNLSQGFPDFPVSDELIKLVHQYMQKGCNQYAPMAGVFALRDAIANKTQKLYQATYDPDTEITITSGATQAIYTAISAMVHEGDEVIVFEPAYDCYVPAIELNGGKPVFVSLKFPDYQINWEEVKKLIKQKTKMIIINTPHNPTGSTLTAVDLQKLEKLTQNTDIVILSDEVYEHIVFDGHQHQSVARFPKLAERSLIVSSFGKTYHTTGWKLGYCIGPKNLMNEFRKVHQFMVFAANHPIQMAYADYLQQEEAYTQLSAFYHEKRDYFVSLLSQSRLKILPCAGTYFQTIGYDAVSDENDVEFAHRLTKEKGIAAIPVSVFYHKPQDNKVLRFCFAKEVNTLEKAAEILCKL